MIGDPNLPREPSAYPRLITRLYELFRRIDLELRVYRGQATINPASITPGGMTTATATVSGASFGDAVTVFPPYDMQGVIALAYVSAENQITVVIANPGTGGAVDLGSGTWKFKVQKY